MFPSKIASARLVLAHLQGSMGFLREGRRSEVEEQARAVNIEKR